MALTVTEAVAVNTLLNFLLHDSHPDGQPVVEAEAKAAMVTLSTSADKKLRSGVSPNRVKRRWRNRIWKTKAGAAAG